MSEYTQFQNPSIESHFDRHRQLRQHACPVGCHQHSNYLPDQYHEYECEHQKAHRERPRLLKEYMWILDHTQVLESKGEITTYWENQAEYLRQQLQRSLDLWIEEIDTEKARSKAMPHIYG